MMTFTLTFRAGETMRPWRFVCTLAAALLTTALVIVVNPASGQAAGEWTPLFNKEAWFNNNFGYMAIRGGVSAGPGAEAVVWSHSTVNGQTVGDQQWKMQSVGNGQVWLRNAGTSNQYALSVKGNSSANGTPVIQWWFDATNQYERWEPIIRADYGWVQFRNVGANYKCLAVQGAGGSATIALGARLILWDCGPGEDQQWHDDTFE